MITGHIAIGYKIIEMGLEHLRTELRVKKMNEINNDLLL